MTRRTSNRSTASKALAAFCLLACCPCCFPCYIGIVRSSRKRQRRGTCVRGLTGLIGEENVHSPSDVRPLPSRRRRLSISDVTASRPHGEDGDGQLISEKQCWDLDDDQAYCTQEQCLLFSKLPLELRQMIYEECVGGYQMYLMVDSEEKALQHVKYTSDFKGTKHLEEWREARVNHARVLSLLSTCRRIYTEAAPLLYSRNKFTATKSNAILSLTSCIRLNRFNAITSLNFGWTLPSPQPLSVLEHVCAVVASMKGLQRITVKIWPHRPLVGHRQELVSILQTLKTITRPKSYVVSIVASELANLNVEDAPFTLQWSLLTWV